MTLKNIYLWTFISFLLSGCGGNRLDVDVASVKVNFDYVNVDSVLINTDSVGLLAHHQTFKKTITDIYAYEIGYCMGIGDVADSAFYNSIVKFKADTSIRQLEEFIKKAYADKKEMERTINEGFKHLKYHFKDKKMPRHIVYLNSLFRSGVFCTEEEIGIGLEYYLGADNEIVKQLDPKFYFDWMKKGMDVKYLERDVLTGWIETHYVEPCSGNLAENIIRWGKILYLTEAAFPKKKKNIIMRYSEKDYEWALDNEYDFWKYLVDEKLLFKIDERTTMNMINEGPFTPGLPDQKSPDRLGQFIGWQMVRKYMGKSETSLLELLDLPYNDILQEYEIE